MALVHLCLLLVVSLERVSAVVVCVCVFQRVCPWCCVCVLVHID